MNKYHSSTALCGILLLAASGGSSVAQQSPSEMHAGMQCGGQYECIEDRPLTAPRPGQAAATHSSSSASGGASPGNAADSQLIRGAAQRHRDPISDLHRLKQVLINQRDQRISVMTMHETLSPTDTAFSSSTAAPLSNGSRWPASEL